MRVIDAEKLKKAGLARHEQFFVALWYSMTHMQSLDSYRVKCMNARTIIRELSDELRIGRINDPELTALCDETAAILTEDPIVKTDFAANVRDLSAFLKDPPVAKDKKDKASFDTAERRREFMFAAEDFAVALERTYFRRICETLLGALKPGNELQIKALTGALLTDLVDQG